MITFKMFHDECKKEGLRACEYSLYHWQITGGKFIVNFFRGRKGEKVYIDKSNGAIPASWKQAIIYANKYPRFMKPTKRKASSYTKYKHRLWEKSQVCAICKHSMLLRDASVDYIIPLEKGGLNNPNNYQLVHINCNTKKGNYC